MSADAPDVTDQAAVRRADLVECLVSQGLLKDRAWRAAFAEVPAHVFVPCYYDSSGRRIAADDPACWGQWLDGVYADRQLVVRRTGGAATATRSEPSLMARMVEALHVESGMHVLEVGTGTGHNAALLSHRLGSANVVTVDLVAELAALARARLADAGYRPMVDARDGAQGYPLCAPYHRIIATCKVDVVPLPWVRQLTDGGCILAPVGNALAYMTRTGRESAEGRFLAGHAVLAPLRDERDERDEPAVRMPRRRVPALPEGPWHASMVPLDILADDDFRFLVGVIAPGLVWQDDFDDERRVIRVRVWADDGSVAGADADGAAQAGPRSLWTLLESAYRVFDGTGGPSPDCFGLSIRGAEQWVWLESPGGLRWPLAR